ncbi:unnamed protein product [Kluyveromyces dobzhanskii CBS 2104]|uniref:WGS project CCBQ000000000 data, contig 00049 n=1 Tax=Kluyveromyces dobzhanskii CBS 2104 TaxID=1427455 RepID=A0A0A8L4P3_9SACH|nr:unnamed protein product [Kluyveromyces dobzhanskii CBS 2104]
MPTILYSSNSKQLSRFQRKTKNTYEQSNFRANTHDIPFSSKKDKDSNEYLLELCCSIYPLELHTQIHKCPDWKLPFHAIVVLLLKNFICSWYGGKIVTTNTEFLVSIYQLFDGVIDDIHSQEILWEQILCDDLPAFIETQVKILRRVQQENLSLDDFYQLQLYKHTYPDSIADVLVQKFRCDSRLHQAFLQDFVGDFLLDKLIDKLAEPFVVIDIVRSVCENYVKRTTTIPKKGSGDNLFQKLICQLRASLQMSSKSSSNDSRMNKSYQSSNNFFNHYLFFALNECFHLESKKPLIFLMLKALQYCGNKLSFINKFTSKLFQNMITQRVLNGERIIALGLKARHLIFPHDNKIGPARMEPSPDEFVIMKKNASDALNQLIQGLYIDKVLGLASEDCCRIIDALAYDKNINKFMVQRLVDYLLASLPAVSTSANIL